MRLLNAQTQELHTFREDDIPAYAILSHTWGDEEVTFHDIERGPYSALKAKSGWDKIQHCCRQALHDGLAWVWVDTCCIDKTSSAELQEAINSMFRWYEVATECYVHLFDVASPSELAGARWFRRGWTLQELLAPGSVRFFDAAWAEFGDKFSLSRPLSAATGIAEDILLGSVVGVRPALDAVSVAQRMSWAARRETTRVEDLAYCLLGVFDVSMPLLYGEGPKAFRRLQEEIIKVSDDQSILAWGAGRETTCLWGVSSALAQTPADFVGCGDMVSWGAASPGDFFSMAQRGLQLNLPIAASLFGGDLLYCILSCTTKQLTSEAGSRVLAVPLLRAPHYRSRMKLGADGRNPKPDEYSWLSSRMPLWLDENDLSTAPRQCIHLPRLFKHGNPTRPRLHMGMEFSGLSELGFIVAGTYPPEISEHQLIDVGAPTETPANVVMVHFSKSGGPGFVLVMDYSDAILTGTGEGGIDEGHPRDISSPNDPDAVAVGTIKEAMSTCAAESICDVRATVRKIIADEIDVEASDVQDTDNLYDIGIDSLLSLRITSRIREELDIDFPSHIFIDERTIGGLLNRMRFATRPNYKLCADKVVRRGLRDAPGPAAPQITLRDAPRLALAEVASSASLVGFVADEPLWRQLSYTAGPRMETDVLQGGMRLVAVVSTVGKTNRLLVTLESTSNVGVNIM